MKQTLRLIIFFLSVFCCVNLVTPCTKKIVKKVAQKYYCDDCTVDVAYDIDATLYAFLNRLSDISYYDPVLYSTYFYTLDRQVTALYDTWLPFMRTYLDEWYVPVELLEHMRATFDHALYCIDHLERRNLYYKRYEIETLQTVLDEILFYVHKPAWTYTGSLIYAVSDAVDDYGVSLQRLCLGE